METRWLPTPDFEGTANFKEFFLINDALCNLDTELVFSAFKRYMCKAGCKMCYVKDMWMSDSNFDAFVPKTVTPAAEDRILDAWNYFEIVSMMDDLFWIKKKYPHLFDFYKRNSHRLSSTAMTDVAFIQQFDIVMNEMDFKYVYEISFSDRFLNKNGGKFADDIIARLTDVHAKSPLQKVKFIICDDLGEKDPNVRKVIDWAHERNIYTDIHDDITQGENQRFELETVDHQEKNHYSEESYPFLILCEVTYLQWDEMFMTITDALSEKSIPFYSIEESKLEPRGFIRDMLNAKIAIYQNNIQHMSRTHSSAKYIDYFSYIGSSVKVNDDYTFIPNFMLKPYTQMYKVMSSTRPNYIPWAATKYGLLEYHSNPEVKLAMPVPLVTIAEKPKQKLYHIPIKCARPEARV
jgi:hypothetical protein